MAVEAGARTIEHAIFLTDDGVKYDAALAARIRDSGIYVNPSNAFAVRATMGGRTGESEGAGPEFVAELREARLETWQLQYQDGVPLIPGSDGGWYATPVQDYARMPELMVSEIGMSPSDALRACTQVAAGAIGMDKELGTIEEGKYADLVAVDGDPLSDIKNLWNVADVFLRGQRVDRGSEESIAAVRQQPPENGI